METDVVYGVGEWEFGAIPSSQHLWAWTPGGFVWRVADRSKGDLSIFDGAAELVEFTTGTLRTRSIVPIDDNGDWRRAQAELVKRPRRAVLAAEGEALCFAKNWTLTREGDGTLSIACSKEEGGQKTRFRVKVDAPGLVHLKGSKVLSNVSLAR